MKHLSLILLGLLLYSCEEVIDISDPGYESELMIYASLSAGKNPTIYITETVPLQGWVEQELQTIYTTDLSPVIIGQAYEQTLEGTEIIQIESNWFSNQIDTLVRYAYISDQ
ncbi:MAG: hypothetical protein AAFQ87_10395, partial [Bacteroidota bacterium]